MRQVYALLGLVKKWGPERVESACARRARGRGIERPAHRPDDRARHGERHVQEPLPIKMTRRLALPVRRRTSRRASPAVQHDRPCPRRSLPKLKALLRQGQARTMPRHLARTRRFSQEPFFGTRRVLELVCPTRSHDETPTRAELRQRPQASMPHRFLRTGTTPRGELRPGHLRRARLASLCRGRLQRLDPRPGRSGKDVLATA